MPDAPAPSTIADLFDPAPSTWGLRGDPFLWEEVRSDCVGVPLPSSRMELRAELVLRIEALIGASLGTDAAVFVARHAHGGMSSGKVSTSFWIDTAIPLLLARYPS